MTFAADKPTLRVGSKNFNEGYLLSEILAQLLEVHGFAVDRQFGLGGTLICYQALKNDEIDVYVEYTGTLSQAILNLTGNPDRATLNRLLEPQGLMLLQGFGFNNTYAIAVKESLAEQRNLVSIADLASAPNLRVVLSHEFLERQDGWPGLSAAYGLTQQVRGIEHGLAYKAIDDGAIDVTDAYSTDGELFRYQLRVLEDERGYFPDYLAAPLVRLDMHAEAVAVLAKLVNKIDATKMQTLNARVVFEGADRVQVAADFLRSLGYASQSTANSLWRDLARNTLRHLQLTGFALLLAIVVGVGLSLVTYRRRRLAEAVIYLCGLLQTIPSIALLALMIPVFGIGFTPAVVALFLYSLLPILRNAVTALTHIEPTLLKVATAIGLSERERLRYVMLPLSMPAIFAGIKTAAVISIGTATLAAFIGAGGLGDPIVVGLSLDDVNLILQGAIPAACLAILTELLFSYIERKVTQN
jgi:osmoprotectant transport system permease protein